MHIVLEGDCIETMRGMGDASIDAIVTDPPYELGFMGKRWDATGIAFNVDVWREALRVLKPGGHMLAFSGTRTYHRMACAIEDAGFEIRDQLAWMYGSGFPKSLDVSKAIDACNGNATAWRAFSTAYAAAVGASKLTHADIDRTLGIKSSSCYWARLDHRGGMPPRHHWEKVRALLDLPDAFARLYDEAEREVLGPGINAAAKTRHAQKHAEGGNGVTYLEAPTGPVITAPATPEAKQWAGWGTALKPAQEPIVLARKPLIGTVAANVLAHGTGAINIDACRIGTDDTRSATGNRGLPGWGMGQGVVAGSACGRWPANVILDEVAGEPLGESSRFFYCAKASKAERESGLEDAGIAIKSAGELTDRKDGSDGLNSPRAGAGRGGGRRNNHPTVKPIALMAYLARLITPPGGTVLDPFAGSGSTGVACKREGFRFVGIDNDASYCELARARIANGQAIEE